MTEFLHLLCCAKLVIRANLAFRPSGPYGQPPTHAVLRVDAIHCETCGTVYEVDVDQPVKQVQRDAVALRILPVRRRPS